MPADALARTLGNRALSQSATVAIYTSAFGVTADGVTDNTAAMKAAIEAADIAGSTSAKAHFVEIILPAGTIRITAPITVANSLTSVKLRLRGAGRDSTNILADFFTTDPAPYFTMTGGGGTGAQLYPVIEFGQLKRVYVINGGTGYTSAPTAVLTTPAGTGASVTCTVSGGAVTSVAVNAAGSGYTNNYAGDALVVTGQSIEISDLTVTSSPARQAASNGGTAAYPYFTTNNGIRYEPLSGYAATTTMNRLMRASVSKQPGHGINAARQEQWLVDGVISSSNGADGLILHSQGVSTGISNRIQQGRFNGNGYRGMTWLQVVQSTAVDCCVFGNLQAVTLPAGGGLATVLEQIYQGGCVATMMLVDVEMETGGTGGRDLIKLAGCRAPKVSGYFRGGRYGVFCASTRSPIFDNISHYGNPADPSNAILLFDAGTGNDPRTTPVIGGVDNFGNVNLMVNRDPASLYSAGLENGATLYNSLVGSQYAVSASTTYTPFFLTNGCDQVVTLTGNVAFQNPTQFRAGAQLKLIMVQDATGARTPTFGTAYLGCSGLGGGTASQIGILDLQYVSAGGRAVWIKRSWSGWL